MNRSSQSHRPQSIWHTAVNLVAHGDVITLLGEKNMLMGWGLTVKSKIVHFLDLRILTTLSP
jgi:hypothetical protein